MIDLDALQAAAEAATPGLWELSCPRPDGRNAVRVNYAPIFPGDLITGTWIIFDTAPEDASFIAAANPAVVLDLVAAHRAALARIARVEAVVEEEKHWNEGCGWDVPSGAVLRALTEGEPSE